jgi:alanine dehydrogenase
MSEVAGRMSVQEGAKYLGKTYGGRGILLGGVPGVASGKGIGYWRRYSWNRSSKNGCGPGCRCYHYGCELKTLALSCDIMPTNVKTLMSNNYNISEYVARSRFNYWCSIDTWSKSSKLDNSRNAFNHAPRHRMVDVAIDQGGCFETSNPTTHDNPTYEVDGM